MATKTEILNELKRRRFDIYLELYKRKEYDKIPLGYMPDGSLFYPTKKQVLAFQYLNDDTTTFVGYGGSGRCFVGDTLIQTSNGHKRIDCIVAGDYVLSYNVDLDKIEFKKVLKAFRFICAEPPKMITFTSGLTCKYDHEFLFRGKWTKAIELTKRVLETDRRQLSYIKYGEVSIRKPQGEQQINVDETCARRSWIFEDNDSNKWKTKNSENAQISGSNIYFKRRFKTTGKPYQFQKRRQPIGKSRMVYCERERKAFCKIRSISHIQKRAASTSELSEKRRRQRELNFNRKRCFVNSTIIQTSKSDKGNISRKVWSKAVYNQRCNFTSKLGSREITENEIIGAKTMYMDVPIYDLHVEDNHNYTVTNNNIVVHNSGKSIIECTAIIFDCFAYEDYTWGLARKELTTLKRTVLRTLFNQFDFYGITTDLYNYNQQLNKITFKNLSKIDLIDSAYQPSDPLNTRFGGYELDKCAIDESNETDPSVIIKLFERTGWGVGKNLGHKRKVFECFNPAKNHVYSRYYVPYRDKNEPEHKKFIPALPNDNPHPSVQEWVKDIISTGDKTTIERLIYGNFEYDDDPTALCTFDKIQDIFTNDHVVEGSETYISADLAMQGRDRFVAGHWKGLVGHIDIDMPKATGKVIELTLKMLKIEKACPNSHIVADADGLGNYLDSYIENIVAFHGNKRAFDQQYSNIKSECGFKLAELINKGQLKVVCSSDQEESLKTELSACLKRENIDADDQKKRLISKDKMKSDLQRSPDYFDWMLLRMYFELYNTDISVKTDYL